MLKAAQSVSKQLKILTKSEESKVVVDQLKKWDTLSNERIQILKGSSLEPA
jgi:hypothetical protein